MKNFIFSFLLAAVSFINIQAQGLSQVHINRTGSNVLLSFKTEDNALINITKDGQLAGFGMENLQRMITSFPIKLDPYMGRVENYTDMDDAAVKGKVKYIGKTLVTYYNSYEKEELRGKVKSIGTTNFVYYENVEDKAYAGNLKSAGNSSFAYYSSFDNEDLRGKFKRIGNINITYYSSFDDKSFRGKLKTIDNNSFTYYSSYEIKEYRGMNKTGFQTKIISGVKFTVYQQS
ncbi:MAG: hypothetical protein WAT19_15560 [Ferruginibacter sp.]